MLGTRRGGEVLSQNTRRKTAAGGNGGKTRRKRRKRRKRRRISLKLFVLPRKSLVAAAGVFSSSLLSVAKKATGLWVAGAELHTT